MTIIKHTSRIKEINKSGGRNSIVYTGDFEELQTLQSMNEPGTVNEEIGKVSSARLYQSAAKFWELELVCELTQGDSVTGPDTSYGKKSAQLRGTMLSLPLASHPDYLACWDHYLFAAPGVTEVPSFWEKTQFPLLTEAAAQKYRWGKSPADAPETAGKRWNALKSPVMPGVESYDVSTYSLIISARFSSFSSACRMVAGHLNKVSADPGINTGINGGDWKCDDATVQWHERYWLATLTWTQSGDDSGWNKRLYK